MYTDPDYGSGHQHPIATTELWTADYSAACGNHHQRIMMKFDLVDFAGMEVDSAFLNIYRWFRCPNHYYTVANFYNITQDWSEDSWNELVHINHEASSWKTYTFGPDNDWYRIDIKSAIENWLDGTVTNYGLVVQATYGEKWSKFYSKEGPMGLRPYLEMYFPGGPDNCCLDWGTPGDADKSGTVNLTDILNTISYVYVNPLGEPQAADGCNALYDANGDGSSAENPNINLTDILNMISHVYVEPLGDPVLCCPPGCLIP